MGPSRQGAARQHQLPAPCCSAPLAGLPQGARGGIAGPCVGADRRGHRRPDHRSSQPLLQGALRRAALRCAALRCAARAWALPPAPLFSFSPAAPCLARPWAPRAELQPSAPAFNPSPASLVLRARMLHKSLLPSCSCSARLANPVAAALLPAGRRRPGPTHLVPGGRQGIVLLGTGAATKSGGVARQSAAAQDVWPGPASAGPAGPAAAAAAAAVMMPRAGCCCQALAGRP